MVIDYNAKHVPETRFAKEQEEERVTHRLPETMREVPDSWWDVVLDGRSWYISSENFEIKAASLANIRLFAYRRAASRGLRLTSATQSVPARLFLQAVHAPGLRGNVNWERAQPAPPMHLVDRLSGRGVAEEWLKVTLSTLRGLGYRITPPGAPEVPDDVERLAALTAPEVLATMPVPEGWTRSQYTARLLPPGVPDIKGANYPEDASAREIRQIALEFQEIASRCTCATDDLDKHPPTCEVWGK